MRVLLNASFTGANMPTIALPAGTIPAPLAFPISSLSTAALAWFEARYGVSHAGTVTSWADQLAGSTDVLSVPSTRTAPTYAAALQNGLPGIQDTNAAGQSTAQNVQQLSSISDVASLAFDYTQPFTAVCVMKTGAAFNQYSVLLSHASGFTGWWLMSGGTGTGNDAPAGAFALGLFNSYTSPAAVVHGSTPLQPNKAYIVTVKSDGTGTAAGITILVNAVAEGKTTMSDTLGTASIKTSGQALCVFDLSNSPGSQVTEATAQTIFGFMIFNKVTTAADDTAIDTYFNNAYAIH